MNRLQKELINLLECFMAVCQEHNLTWFLINGSALGAEKYGGFIPWDDDVDVAMPRKDYEMFCEKAKESLPSHLFLQNYKTQKAFPLFYSKLRNSNTTFIEEGVKHLDINHGIYIDIFPLDGYPDGKVAQKVLTAKLKLFSTLQFCGFENDMSWKKRFLRLFGFHKRTDKTMIAMEKNVKRYQNTKQICDYGDRQGKGCYPREIYERCKMVRFERLQVPIPALTDEYFSCKYGDWKAELPPEQQKSHHRVVVCDLDTPYTQYKI